MEAHQPAWSFINDDPNSPVALGFRFQSSSPGHIVQAAWINLLRDTFTHLAFLTTETFELLRVHMFLPSPIAGGEAGATWVRRNLHPGWHIQANTIYTFFVWMVNNAYAYAPHALDGTRITEGPITIQPNPYGAAFQNGVYAYSWPQNLTFSGANGTLYGVDFAFRPSSR